MQRLKGVYGDQIKLTYKMGGMTDDVSDWRKEYEVSEDDSLKQWISESSSMTGMPSDPECFLKTEVKSTWPTCIAVKAAQLQGEEMGERFYRRMMEAILIESKNGSDEDVYREIANDAGLNVARMIEDIKSGKARKLFENDKKEMNVSFLTLSYVNKRTGEKKDLSNSFSAAQHEKVVDELTGSKLVKRTPIDILEYMEEHKGNLIPAKEIAEVFATSQGDARSRMSALAKHRLVDERGFGFGTFWSFSKNASTAKLTVEQVKLSHVTEQAQVASEIDLTEIVTRAVKGLYTEVAINPQKTYHFPLGRKALLFVGYPEKEINKLPETALESFAGVGYPHGSGAIRPGDIVLDVGSGSGTDVLYASLLTGPTGKVFGLDMTDAMIEKARANIEKMGAKNVRIINGDATKMPFDDSSVDVVSSNGVLNLVPDKRKAFQEIFRILKPGGRIQIADIVVQSDVQKVCGLVPQLWADCIGGAAVESEYLKTIREAGFEDLRTINRVDYFSASSSDNTKRLTRAFEAESIVIRATKPKQ